MRVLPLILALLLVMSLGAAAGVYVVSTSADYELSVVSHSAIDTPERTVEEPPREYTFTSLAVIDRGDDLSVAVSVPGNEYYTLRFLNPDGDSAEFLQDEGDNEERFEGVDYEYGSYMLALEVDSIYEAMYPVVISAHDLDISHDTEATTDESLDVSVDVNAVSGAAPDPIAAEVVLWNDETTKRFDLSQASGDTWDTTIDLSSFDPGEYDIYVATLGEETDWDEREIYALAESDVVTITEAPDDDGSDDGTGLPDDGNGEPDDSDDENGEADDADDSSGGGGGTAPPPGADDDGTDADDGDGGSDDENGIADDDAGADDEHGVADDDAADGNGVADDGSEPGDDDNGETDDTGEADDGGVVDDTGDGDDSDAGDDADSGIQLPIDDGDDSDSVDTTTPADDDEQIIWAPVLILGTVLGVGVAYRTIRSIRQRL